MTFMMTELNPKRLELLSAAFLEGLAETGYVEGQNAAIEYRWAEGRYDRLPALAAELVKRGVDVIVTQGGIPPTRAALVDAVAGGRCRLRTRLLVDPVGSRVAGAGKCDVH